MKLLDFRFGAAALGLVVFAAAPASALISFGAPTGLNSNAITDSATDDGQDTDKEPSIAVGAGGFVLHAWSSNNTLGDTIGTDLDILVSTSTNDGRTWSSPAALNTTAGTDGGSADTQPQLVFGGGTAWMAVWTSAYDLGGIGTDTDILASFSNDNGASWSAPVAVNSDASSDTSTSLDQAPALAGRDSGARRWVIGWQKIEGSTTAFFYASSIDDSGTWAARSQLGSDTTTGLSQGIALAFSDPWFVAAWSTLDGIEATGTDTEILTAVIADVTFNASGPVELNLDSFVDDRNDKFPTLAVSNNKVIAAWEGNEGSGALAEDTDIYFAVSDDATGASWGPTGTLNSNAATDTGDDEHVSVAADGTTVLAAWSSNDDLEKTIKSDSDILTTRSTDEGLTWSTVKAVASTASKDKGGDEDAAAAGRGDTWLVGWRTDDTLSKTLGPDRDLLYVLSVQDCPSAPQAPATCVEPQLPKKASVLIKNKAKKDLFKWIFAKGAATTKAGDLGDPTTIDDYVACVYDQDSDSNELIVELDIFSGGNCYSKPCWKEVSTGYIYKHKFGAAGQLILKEGADGKSKAQVKSTFGFPTPALPLLVDSTLTVQLHNLTSGTCWSSSFSTPIVNTAGQFKAKSD
ncbi:MAG: hypothetical protein ACI91F_001892 [Candidatus Binatia bacterium]|jgi:hypothetical protein